MPKLTLIEGRPARDTCGLWWKPGETHEVTERQAEGLMVTGDFVVDGKQAKGGEARGPSPSAAPVSKPPTKPTPSAGEGE